MVDESLGESEGVSHVGNNREKVPRRAVLLSLRRSCFPSSVRFILKSGVGEAAKGRMLKDQLFIGSAQYIQLPMCRKMATRGATTASNLRLFYSTLPVVGCCWETAFWGLLPKSCGC
ncbi:unnamed protein product [Ectocarpus sp. 12 AP-2014]